MYAISEYDDRVYGSYLAFNGGRNALFVLPILFRATCIRRSWYIKDGNLDAVAAREFIDLDVFRLAGFVAKVRAISELFWSMT